MAEERTALSEKELAAVSSQLGEIVRESGWARTVAIGDLLVERLFRGAPDAIGAPIEACKHPSIRKLAQRPDCPLRKTALAQAIGVYAVIRKEPALRELAGITPAHVALVVSLPSETRREMLTRAEAEKWSVRTLSKVTREFGTSVRTVRTGRRASSQQTLAFYKSSLQAAESGLRLLWRHEEMDPEVSAELSTTLQSLATVLNDSAELVVRMRRNGEPRLEDADAQPPSSQNPRLLNPGRPKAAMIRSTGMSPGVPKAS